MFASLVGIAVLGQMTHAEALSPRIAYDQSFSTSSAGWQTLTPTGAMTDVPLASDLSVPTVFLRSQSPWRPDPTYAPVASPVMFLHTNGGFGSRILEPHITPLKITLMIRGTNLALKGGHLHFYVLSFADAVGKWVTLILRGLALEQFLPSGEWREITIEVKSTDATGIADVAFPEDWTCANVHPSQTTTYGCPAFGGTSAALIETQSIRGVLGLVVWPVNATDPPTGTVDVSRIQYLPR